MRTTIRMNEAMAQRVKAVTEKTGMTFTQAVERGICLFLAEHEQEKGAPAYEPPPVSKHPGPVPSPEQLRRIQEEMDLEYDLAKLKPCEDQG